MSDKRVRDLMLALSEYATIDADRTIQEALQALSKAQLGLDNDRHHHRAVLVIEQDGRVIGKLSHWAVLRALQPKFLRQADLESMVRAGVPEEFVESMRKQVVGYAGNLERMCHHAAQVKARDAMVPVLESIEDLAPLTEAIQEMILKHCQSMLVTRAGEVIGILRLSDVFDEIATRIRNAECSQG